MENAFEMTICDEIAGSKATILRCGPILRRIGGRRTVYEGQCHSRPAIIKCFTSAFNGKRHFTKEVNGFRALKSRGLQTADILAMGKNNNGHHVLVLEKIQHAADIFSLVESAKHTSQIFEAVFRYLGKMHAAGVTQRDLHLGNFLWDGQSVYALDPAEMSFSKNPLDSNGSFKQLGCLFASLPESYWDTKRTLLETYFQMRQWNLDDPAIGAIELLTYKKRLRRVSRILRKSLRSSKRYIRKKQGRYSGVFLRDIFADQNILSFMQDVDEQMEAGKILKRGNTCFVSKINIGNQDIVVKRYNHKGLWHSLRHTLKGSRAKKCWLFGHRLSEAGIACAKPLAFIEQRKNGLIWQSYILNEFVNGPELHEVMNGDNDTNQQKEDILSKSKKLLENLTNARMTHGDMKPANLLACNGEPVLIDLDSMQYHRCSWILLKRSEKMTAFFHNRLHGKKCTE
ncbi:MAG: hypothetical protein H8E17_17715 [Deltaproteobacteria bacterium]|nr:hypothetical protein [Deltaproteobacteria bacterium]